MQFKLLHYSGWKIFLTILFIIALIALTGYVLIQVYNSQFTFFVSEETLYILLFVLVFVLLFFWRIQKLLATSVILDFQEDHLLLKVGSKPFQELKYSKLKVFNYDLSDRSIGSLYDFLYLEYSNSIYKKFQLKNSNYKEDLDRLNIVCEYIKYKFSRQQLKGFTFDNERVEQIIASKLISIQKKETEKFVFVLPNSLYILISIVYALVIWSMNDVLLASIAFTLFVSLCVVNYMMYQRYLVSLGVISAVFSLIVLCLIHFSHLSGLYAHISFVLLVQIEALYKDFNVMRSTITNEGYHSYK